MVKAQQGVPSLPGLKPSQGGAVTQQPHAHFPIPPAEQQFYKTPLQECVRTQPQVMRDNTGHKDTQEA